ncbi:MAG: hypothetical protein WAM85_04030 [Terracidiphilus sp.]
MNFTQMHEHLRLELVRRIQRGTLSVSLLARETGFGQSHLSNFLHNKSQLSLQAMDRILSAQHMVAGDLLPVRHDKAGLPAEEDHSLVPVVSHSAALFEPFIRPSAARSVLSLPSAALESFRTRTSSARRAWQRFVAVRIPSADTLPMDPLVLPEALAVIDRHYNSLIPYRAARPTLYAVRNGAHLVLRYVEFLSSRLVLRPHNLAFPIDVIETEAEQSPNDLIAGRVALILNET